MTSLDSDGNKYDAALIRTARNAGQDIRGTSVGDIIYYLQHCKSELARFTRIRAERIEEGLSLDIEDIRIRDFTKEIPITRQSLADEVDPDGAIYERLMINE